MDLGIVVGDDEWCFPIEAVCHPSRRTRLHEPTCSGLQVNAPQRTVLALEVDLVWIGGVDETDETITTTDPPATPSHHGHRYVVEGPVLAPVLVHLD